mmetsp:Transcript_8612/g.8507  ORF Transcript_8612/g.8507 Transcript_8612/m.8507 type:complete len:379 (-) Transcript_8612:67-1203(-)
MNYSKNEAYDQVPSVLNQFKVQNIENLDYPLVTGDHGNMVQTRNIQPNIAVQAEPTNPMEPQAIVNGSISITNVSNGNHTSELPNKSHTFEFHDPFDIHSYPITNPPIFDSTMMLPYTSNEGIPRRRRISISNGQIGQIINHEFYLDNESPLDEELNGPRLTHEPISKDDTMMNDVQPQHNRVPVRPSSTEQFLQIQQPQLPQKEMEPQAPLKVRLDLPVGQQQRTHAEDSLKSETPTTTKGDPPAGVPPPNHQLIYNNEVIYNPNNGPIPGTAAWKKERLLERNRLAASKCRQRKKHAQQQLQNNISKYQKDVDMLKDKLTKYEKVFKNFTLIIAKHADKFPELELKTLTKFSDMDSITEKDLDAMSKIAGTEHRLE